MNSKCACGLKDTDRSMLTAYGCQESVGRFRLGFLHIQCQCLACRGRKNDDSLV